MDENALNQILAECESIAEGVSEPYRVAAFSILLGRRLQQEAGGAQAARVATSQTPVVTNVAQVMRRTRSAREKMLVAIGAADSDGTGVSLTSIRETLTTYRQPLPKNIPRDVGQLVKAGLVLPIAGAGGRGATYGLSAEGDELYRQLCVVNE
jgi:hypothetical protein